ncbi:gp184a [Mycobacterium phage Omega]|uniref:Uncharacterized protein n=1 Tax=Mycobacterium phage Omega TaxID=2907835 RepID=Q853Y1_BPMOM|nr:gp184a [Mycobacterium phage Omega]AAN12827.1 hypothetical protein PBI_OMEGA_184a [Mycobacterium phage Omega]
MASETDTTAQSSSLRKWQQPLSPEAIEWLSVQFAILRDRFRPTKPRIRSRKEFWER